MPRKARIVILGVAHHVIQRGHNRQVVFAIKEDFQCYLENLVEIKNAFGVKLYAYCLMTNHVHLLLVPARPKGLAFLLKHLAARQTRYVNTIESRTGTLWEGRYKSRPVETETYLLACSRTIELNPVRAGIVASPELIAGRATAGRLVYGRISAPISIRVMKRWVQRNNRGRIGTANLSGWGCYPPNKL